MSTIATEADIPLCTCACCCKDIRYQRISSAKTSTIWNTRNDSSNVSSLLAPDLLDAGSELSTTIVSKLKHKRNIKSAVRVPTTSDLETHCESCYCRESPVMPKLNSKLTSSEENQGNVVRRSMYNNFGSKESYGVKKLPKDPEGATKNSSEILSKSDLSFTNARNEYESRLGELEKIREDEQRSQITGSSTRSSGNLPIYTQEDRMTYKDFKDLVRFRKDNYFDCHSTVDVTSRASDEHKCVHKFVINDRFLPQPLNVDSFGVSCCEVCNKPMEMYKSRKPCPVSKKKSVNKVKEVYEYNLVPPRINIGCGNETVQIKVPEKLSKQCLYDRAPNFKLGRNVPGNSYALRYQRGRL